mmetsp:Transcript_22581/g.52595  ORF Transcript_22581/g.52595 Transcript_22581/m.52595 type:complete len:678 (+) Transcript_22581:180-2213(+)
MATPGMSDQQARLLEMLSQQAKMPGLGMAAAGLPFGMGGAPPAAPGLGMGTMGLPGVLGGAMPGFGGMQNGAAMQGLGMSVPAAAPVPTPAAMQMPMSMPSLRELANQGANKFNSGKTISDSDVKVQDPSGRVVGSFERYSTFEEAPFPAKIQDALKDAGFPAPSQIQQYCWPLAMQQKDVIGVAATGSGKTISFLLPAFATILDRDLRSGDPHLLVLAPTRELAIQIQDEAVKFGKGAGLKTVCCYGGAPKPPQADAIRSGVHGVIGTPGRVNDFMEADQLDLGRVCKLVLDEADRMLDMGFEPQIKKILAKVPRQRHTMFFTATWPPSVRRLAAEFLNGAFTVTIGNRDELKGNQDITQTLQTCRSNEKNAVLMGILRQAGVADKSNGDAKGLVFCSTKKMCDQLAGQLERNSVPCAAVHGDKGQRDREAALNGLKEGRIKLLVATDVAARGLDIKGVTLVVNYDPPSNTEDYVHRIGRTGRAGQKGHAVALISERDTHALKGIIQVMKRTQQPVSPEIEDLARTAPPPPPSGRAARGGPPPVQIDPNFKPGLSSGGVDAVAPVSDFNNSMPYPSEGGGGKGYGGYGGGKGYGKGKDRDRDDFRDRGRSPPRRRSPSRRRRSPSGRRRSPSVRRPQRQREASSDSSRGRGRGRSRSRSRGKRKQRASSSSSSSSR